MKMTKHAEKRIEQRCIPGVVIDLILDYGKSEYHRGAEKLWLDKKGLRQAKRYLGKPHQNYGQLLKDIYLVVDGETVITAARRDRHHKRDRH